MQAERQQQTQPLEDDIVLKMLKSESNHNQPTKRIRRISLLGIPIIKVVDVEQRLSAGSQTGPEKVGFFRQGYLGVRSWLVYPEQGEENGGFVINNEIERFPRDESWPDPEATLLGKTAVLPAVVMIPPNGSASLPERNGPVGAWDLVLGEDTLADTIIEGQNFGN